MECIDVEQRFPQYKLGYEDHVVGGTQDPWLKTILCRRGSICPSGGSKLWACTSGRLNAAARAFIKNKRRCELGSMNELTHDERTELDSLQAEFIAGEIPDCATIKMDGDDGVNAEFDVKDAATVFKLMKAKRR